MTGGGWSCPHETGGLCSKVNDLPCNPGMKGCELYSRYVFFDGSKNERLLEKRARAATNTPPTESPADSPDDAPDTTAKPG